MSYESMISFMFDAWRDDLGWNKEPTIGSFSGARSTICVDECRLAWQQSRDYVESRLPDSQRRGLVGGRTVAIDGSWVVTPAQAGCSKRWQRNSATKKDGNLPNPQALVITGWELASRLPVGFCVLDKGQGEREGAAQLFEEMAPGDHVLMDRGFPSDYILGDLLDKGIDFTIRMQSGKGEWEEVRSFMKTKEKDAICDVEVIGADGNKYTVPLRFIRRSAKKGRPKKNQKREDMVLITSLKDSKVHSAEYLLNLYSRRWAVETAYKEMKVDFNIEEFHSSTPERIEQELYALLTWLTFSAFIEIKAEKALEDLRGPQSHDDPERYQINRRLLHNFVEWVIRDFFAGGEQWKKRRDSMEHRIGYLARVARKKRPNRSYPRTRKRPYGRANVKKMNAQ